MHHRGIIITGVSGGGKTTISQMLFARDASFEQVKVVTTRSPRPDDIPGVFEYLTDDRFTALEDNDALFVRAEYRGKRYGITRDHFADVEARGKVPVLLLTGKSLFEFLDRFPQEMFLTVFIDAPDDHLDERLGLRGDSERRSDVLRQRAEDRRYRAICARVLHNIDRERALQELIGWWRDA